MCANLNRMGVPLSELRYTVATHYHVDHAGLAQEFKNAGIPLLVLETQAAAIPLMKTHIKPHDRYLEITLNDNVAVSFVESRATLAKLCIGGEILPTPGHTDDSVSLLLDDGSVFTGDLPPAALAEGNLTASASWALLRKRGAMRVYPGHGPVRPLQDENNEPVDPEGA